ncbi:DUF4393 domain-containing protein [Listeria booriae]|uniref:DUF4393 domain-containing protein n=1 Tax=Listeria booriae TaxID=1552123 RepID=UPI0016281E2D|nr:DUF4393 domain-containing protein [Listeria booriae]MBC2316004.1 DUF4393 domain-containing protein [Listeria booriae]
MSDKNQNGININVDALPESTKEALLTPSAVPLGKAIGGIISFSLSPLIKLQILTEAKLAAYEDKVQQKFTAIPEENRDSEKIGLVLKTMEDSRYQLDNELLQEFFANLLAQTVDDRHNHDIHPSFSAILRDLSPQDAELLTFLSAGGALPLIQVHTTAGSNNTTVILEENILCLPNEKVFTTEFGLSISSLERLGLIKIDTTKSVALLSEDVYATFENTEFFQKIMDRFPYEQKISGEIVNFKKPHTKKGRIVTTALGTKLLYTVIPSTTI